MAALRVTGTWLTLCGSSNVGRLDPVRDVFRVRRQTFLCTCSCSTCCKKFGKSGDSISRVLCSTVLGTREVWGGDKSGFGTFNVSHFSFQTLYDGFIRCLMHEQKEVIPSSFQFLRKSEIEQHSSGGQCVAHFDSLKVGKQSFVCWINWPASDILYGCYSITLFLVVLITTKKYSVLRLLLLVNEYISTSAWSSLHTIEITHREWEVESSA